MSCATKKRWNTEKEAKKAMKKNKKHCFAGKLFYYRCNFCNGYHLSKQDPAEFQRTMRYYKLTQGDKYDSRL